MAYFLHPRNTKATLTLHYKADMQALDFWVDDTRLVKDFQLPNPIRFKEVSLAGGADLRFDGVATFDNLRVGIPEPTTLTLLYVTGMMLMHRHRHRH